MAQTSRTYHFNNTTDSFTFGDLTYALNSFYIRVTPTGVNPRMASPTGTVLIPGNGANERNYFRIIMRHNGAVPTAEFLYRNASHPNYVGTYGFYFPVTADNAWHYYTYRIDDIAGGEFRSQAVTGIRLDPADGNGGYIDVDVIALRRDNDPPYLTSVSIDHPFSQWGSHASYNLTVWANDPPPFGYDGSANPDMHGSGARWIGWQIGGGPINWQGRSYYDIIAGDARADIVIPGTSLASGVNELRIYAQDVVGHVSPPVVYEIWHDVSPPGRPIIEVVDPPGWSATNNFYFAWTYPGDEGSGIERFEYRVDGGPLTNAGFALDVGGIAVSPGRHSFEVRAVDGVGLPGALSVPDSFFYDPTGPNAPTGLEVSPPGYTNTNDFTFTWGDGGDVLTETVAFEVRVNGGAPNTVGTFGVSGALATQSGPNSLVVRGIDVAGNLGTPSSIDFYYSPNFIPPPSLLAPATGDTVALPVTFGWDPPTGSAGYEVQVAKNAAFTDSLWTTFSDIASAPVPVGAAPTFGQVYYWRVRPMGSIPPENWSMTETFLTIEAPPPSPEQIVGLEFPAGESGEGVNTSLGAVSRSFTILALRGPGGEVTLDASYSSVAQDASSLGPKWAWTLGQRLDTASPPFAVASLEDGQDVRFRWTGMGYATDLGVYDSLTNTGGGGHELLRPDRDRLLFDSSGKLTSLRDRNGNAITLAYTGLDLTQFTDQAGRPFTVANAAGKVTQISDVLGRRWRFEYDGAGYLSAFIDAAGARTEYSYDGSGRLVRVKDPRGHDALQCSYGGDGRVATQTDALGGVTLFGYDDGLRRTTTTDPLGGVTVHVKDVNSRLLFEVNARGDSTTYTYDANHNRMEVRDGRGLVTRYEYDTRGNIVRKIDPLNAQTRTIYDFNNRLIEETDALGNVTTWTNDANGNPTRIDEPLGRVTLHVYNSAGQVTSTTDPNLHSTAHVYDAQGNRISTTNGAGNVTQFGYDALGRRASMTDGLGHVTTFSYDAADRLLTTTNALPATTTSEYDLNGNRTATVDARGKRTEYVYDAKNRQVSMRDPLGNTTLYFYDALDRRIRTRDPRGNEEVSEYDAVGNLTRTTTALGFQTLNSHDANRNRTSTTDPRGKTTTFAYDAANRLIATTSPLGHVTTTTYDLLGRESVRTNARGRSTTFGYDALDRLVMVQAPTGASIAYGYDPVGNRISRTNANGHTTTYAYDGADRMTQMTDALNAPESFAYDAAGNRIQRTDRSGRVTLYDYDAANRLVRDRYPDATQIERTLDLEGNLIGMADRWGTTAYGYDDAERMITATDHDGRTLGFAYDSTGNRVALVYPGGERVRYGYDADDRLVWVTDWGEKTTTYGYDQGGNNTAIIHPNGVTTTQWFDDDGRLTSLLTQSAAAETLVAVSYQLDPNANRTRLTRVDRRQEPIRTDGRDPYALSALLSQVSFVAGEDSVVAISGESWDEAVAGPGLARRRGAPLLVMPGDNLLYSPEIRGEIERHRTVNPGIGAIMLGEVDGLSATVEGQLGALGLGTRRVFGSNRAATAAMAAGPCSVAVLMGLNDATRSGPAGLLAGRLGASLLYVDQDSVPAATATTLTSLAIPAVILVGDGSTIGAGVTSWLGSHGIAIRRRFEAMDVSELSVAIQEYVESSESPPGFLRLISSEAWQDGLSTGAMIPSNGAALHVNAQDIAASPAVVRWMGLNKRRPLTVLLSGSEAALSASLQDGVRALLRTTTTDFAYNDLDQLVSEVIPGVDSTYFAYDLMGNRASITHNGATQTYAYDNNDRLISAGGVTYGYDANGSRTSRTQGVETTTYEYDFEDRLVRVITPAGESRYRYDGIGRRIRSEEPGVTTQHVVDPASNPYETLEEREAGGALRTAFVHAAGLLSERTATGELRLFHYDGLGSTTLLSDSAGNDVGHLAVTAFGDTALEIGATNTRYRLAGRHGVEATKHGLIFMRDRFYDPAIGTFLSEDPVDGGPRDYLQMATYLYAGGNPVNSVDPDGRIRRSSAGSNLRRFGSALVEASRQMTRAVGSLRPAARQMGSALSALPQAGMRMVGAIGTLGPAARRMGRDLSALPAAAGQMARLPESTTWRAATFALKPYSLVPSRETLGMNPGKGTAFRSTAVALPTVGKFILPLSAVATGLDLIDRGSAWLHRRQPTESSLNYLFRR
jgi:RHS repeat-associated protein